MAVRSLPNALERGRPLGRTVRTAFSPPPVPSKMMNVPLQRLARYPRGGRVPPLGRGGGGGALTLSPRVSDAQGARRRGAARCSARCRRVVGAQAAQATALESRSPDQEEERPSRGRPRPRDRDPARNVPHEAALGRAPAPGAAAARHRLPQARGVLPDARLVPKVSGEGGTRKME